MKEEDFDPKDTRIRPGRIWVESLGVQWKPAYPKATRPHIINSNLNRAKQSTTDKCIYDFDLRRFSYLFVPNNQLELRYDFSCQHKKGIKKV